MKKYVCKKCGWEDISTVKYSHCPACEAKVIQKNFTIKGKVIFVYGVSEPGGFSDAITLTLESGQEINDTLIEKMKDLIEDEFAPDGIYVRESL